MEKFSFIPEDGLRNSIEYPDPKNESETREQLQRPLDQLKTYINNLNDELSTKGTDNIKGASVGDIPAGTIKSQFKWLLDNKIGSENIKGIRIQDNNLEYTLNGIDFLSVPSSGHGVLNGLGNPLPQRRYFKFVDTEVSDDGNATVIKGIIGPAGKDGVGFQITSMFPTVEELKLKHPVGQKGDMYSVGTTEENYTYIWDVDLGDYKNIGRMQGAPGEPGIGVPQGGSAGQVLAKQSSANYDMSWIEVYNKSEITSLLENKLEAAVLEPINSSIAVLNSNKAEKVVVSLLSTRVTGIEEKLNSPIINYTIPVNAWVANIATIPVTGATSTSNHEILPALLTRPTPTQEELANNETFGEAGLQDAGQETGKLYVYAKTVPTIPLNIRIVNRGVK